MLAEFIQLPRAGSNAGAFALKEVLSSSILGTFYQAEHRATGEDCLLLIVPEGVLRTDPRFPKRLQDVVAAQKNFDAEGPALATREISQEGNLLLMRYKQGRFRSLTQRVVSDGPLAEPDARAVLKRVATALQAANAIGQGHYFLTPDFVFFNEADEACLAGLGLFQSIAYEAFERFVSGAVLPLQTHKDKLFSAIEILSPEIRNYKSSDPRSDFYCLGMTAYFLLVGEKPNRNWIVPSHARAGLSPGWDILLSTCLHANPAERFPHHRAFIKALDALSDLVESPKRRGGSRMRALQSIPLPKALERRLGWRALLWARLAMLVLAGVLAVGTAFVLREIIFADISDDPAGRRLTRVSEPGEAQFVLWLQPARTRVEVISGGNGRFFVGGEQLLLRGSPGRYRVRISSPGFIAEEVDLEFTGHLMAERRIVLRPAFVPVEFAGFEQTALYLLSERDLPLFVGELNADGRLSLPNRLLAGDYRLLARHPLTADIYWPVTISADSGPISIPQSILPGSFAVDSLPTGADVFLDDQWVGSTPLQLDSLAPLTDFALRIERDGFHPFHSVLRLEPGQTFVWPETVQLVARTGFLAVELTWPADPPDLADVRFFINDQLLPPPPADGWTLPVGPVTFRIEHPDYLPVSGEIAVREGVLRLVQVSPSPRPARILPAIPNKLSARFLFNGKEVHPASDGSITLPAFLTSELQVDIPQYLSVSRTFTPDANQTIHWDIPLQPLPAPQFSQPYTIPYLGIQLVWIEPGGFMLGSPVAEYRRTPNEDSLTFVRIPSGFWAGTTEITQAQFARIMNANPSAFPNPDHPVEMVSWLNALEFCARLNHIEAAAGRLPAGYHYRLPTEAEWEYFARAGTDSPFSFGSTASPRMGNFSGTYAIDPSPDLYASDHYGTLPAASFPPNPWGLFDVHGNVAEWTLDRYWDRHPGGSAVAPFNDSRGRGHTIRGGSWRDPADQARSAARSGLQSDRARNSVGFRIVLAPRIFSDSFPFPLDSSGGE